jgi:hypothetical protein
MSALRTDASSDVCGRRVLAVIAALALAIALACVHDSPARAAVDSCAHAKALYEARYYERAAEEYTRLLGKPGNGCATKALIAEAHAKAEAATALTEAQLDIAKRLQEAGFPDEARRVLASALKEAQPRSAGKPKQLSDELQRLADRLRSPTQRPSGWQGFLGLYGPKLVFLAELTALVLGAFALALLAFSAARGLVRRWRGSVRLEGFTGSSDSTLGAALTASLGTALARLKDDSPRQNLHYQSGSEPKFEVPAAILEGVPQAKIIAGLIQMLDQLLPREMSLISATVHPVHEDRGAGLTVLLADHRGRGIDQVTLWEKDFLLMQAGANAKDGVRYERLILPAAVWLGYRPELGFKREQPPLGTGDWRSYALFALGELVSDLSERRIMYERALDRDERNLGARLNLADLLLRRPSGDMPGATEDPDDGHRETWRERRAEARRHLEYVAYRASDESDPIWYRARYMQIVLNVYDNQATPAHERAKARHWATQARTCLEELHDALNISNGKDSSPRELLEAMEEPLQILGYTVELCETGSVAKEPDFGGSWLSASAEYNLACFWSRYSGLAEGAAQQTRLRRAIVHLRRSIERTGNAIVEARTDPAFDAIRDTEAFGSIVLPA